MKNSEISKQPKTAIVVEKQIAAANWKMNLTISQGADLLDAIIAKPHSLTENQQAVFAVPSPYLAMAQAKVASKKMYLSPHRIATAKEWCFTPVRFLWKCCSHLASA